MRQFVTRFRLQAISTKCSNGGRTKDLKGMCSTFKIFSSDVMHFNCNLRNNYRWILVENTIAFVSTMTINIKYATKALVSNGNLLEKCWKTSIRISCIVNVVCSCCLNIFAKRMVCQPNIWSCPAPLCHSVYWCGGNISSESVIYVELVILTSILRLR